MRRLLTLIVLAALALSASAKPKASDKEINLRIGTYNVWSHSARKYVIKKNPEIQPRNWDASKQAVAELIVKIDCDLLGMHEVTSVCRDDLAELVKKAGGKKYALWWENTYPEGHRSVVGNAIFYNKKTVELLEWGTYWLSETPDVPSKGWDARCKRTATWARLKIKGSGKEFFYVNTHLDHRGKVAQQKGLELIVKRIAEMNPDGLPMILTGDFNVKPDSPVLVDLDTKMLSARNTGEKTDARATFNGWGQSAWVIDYIYYSGFSACPEYETIVRQYKGVPYISDHYPIVARLVF